MLIKPPPASDLHEAYNARRCPICMLLERSERRYIDITLYEHVTDPKWRAEVRAARGFCVLHTQHIMDIGRSALGASLVAGDILKTLREMPPSAGPAGGGALGRLRSAFGVSSSTAQSLRPQAPCPLCAYLQNLGTVYIKAMLNDITTEQGHRAFQDSVGLCLPHLLVVIKDGGAGLNTLLSHQVQAWKDLEGQLAEFARKTDYRFKEEMSEQERESWRLALRLLSGG